MPEGGLAHVRQLHAAPEAAEERLARIGFERLDLLADGGGAHPQLVGGLGETGVPGRGLEGAEGCVRRSALGGIWMAGHGG